MAFWPGKAKEKTVATPTSKRKTADLSRLAELNKNYRQGLEDLKVLQAYLDSLATQIKKAMGSAHEAKIDGVLAFTYAPTKSYAWGEFAKEHPEIAETYRVKVVKEEVDKDRILREHPTLVEPFRTRQFLVKY